ncbi:hypothetical protein MCAP1_000564 [Malassezia caprae]|uniref:Trafficking protein particle complex subunit 10 n=1 Tax=Malassezia caprae TaxID=1381934 RepID=A0AAF0E936_9BASI|nr:hypothetical protein MCAP1_000564 [Malassezia caprae]
MASPARAAGSPEPVVLITYATHSASAAVSQAAHVASLLRAHLPLRNLLWRPSAGVQCLRTEPASASVPIRTLRELPMQLVPLAAHDASDSRVPVLYRLPPVHLFFVSCDDSDVYRAQVRNEIRHWMAALHQHMPHDYEGLRTTVDGGRDVPAHLAPEYLIVLLPSSTAQVAPGASAGKMGRFYALNKGSVLEKLRADFNTSTTEHVLALHRVPVSTDDNDPVVWIELLARMKEATLASIGRLVEMQDRLSTTYDATSTAPTWSLCTSMLRKEHLVQTLEGLGLVREALALYEQISERLTPAASFPPGGTDEGDDSLLLLGPLRKPYMAQLEQGSMTLFDWHSYLYARTSMLRGTLGQVVEVMEKTPAFIDDVTHTLQPHTHTLPLGFLETWSFSIALDAVEQCQAWLVEAQGERDEPTTRAFHAAKAALLELAVRQMIRIGMQVAHLPTEAPFAFFAPATNTHAKDARLSRKEIVEAMASRDVFDSQCRNMLQRTIQAATLGGQTHRLLRAKYLLASLECVRGAHAPALALYSELAQHPDLPHTLALHGPVHAQRLACLAALEPRSAAWQEAVQAALHSLCLLRCHAPHHATGLDELALLRALAECDTAAPTTLLGYNGCEFRIAHARATRHGDTVRVTVPVVSHLPAALDVEAVHVWVRNYRQDQLQFTRAPLTLRPGVNRVELTCATPLHGYFHVQATQIQLPNVCLESIVQGAASLSSLADAQQLEYMRPRLCLPLDGVAAHARLTVSRHVRLDDRRTVRLHVDSGAQALCDARVSLVPQSEVRPMPATEWRFVAADEPRWTAPAPDLLHLPLVPAHTSWAWDVPLEPADRSAQLDVQVTLRYRGQDDSQERVWHRALHAPIALPFHIQIQDFFRLDTLLSKLSFEALSDGPVHLCAPTITASSSSPIEASVPASGASLWLASRETSTFLVQFSRRPGEVRESNPPFELSVAYRTAHDERCALVLETLARVLSASEQLDWDDGDALLLQDTLCEAPALDDDVWRSILQRWCWDPMSKRAHTVLDLVRRVAAALPAEGPDEALEAWDAMPPAARAAWEASRAHLTWRTLTLPVDVPVVDVVNAVTWDTSSVASVMLGQPVSVTIHVTISWAWALASSDAGPVHLKYHLWSDCPGWVVWGVKMGIWTLDTTQGTCVRTIHTKLQSMCTGFQPFPHVRITPLSSNTRRIRCETYPTHASPGIHVVPPPDPLTYWVDVRAPDAPETPAIRAP